MTNKKAALIVSGIEWNSTYQRHQLNAKLLSEFGYSVDFLQGCKTSPFSFKSVYRFIRGKILHTNSFVSNKLPNGLKLLNCPLMPPMGVLSFILNYFIYKFFLRKKLCHFYDVVIYYVPIDLVHLHENNLYTKVFYDCVRAFAAWGGYHSSLYKNERYLASSCNFILCDSYYINDIYLSKLSSDIPRLHLLPPLEVNTIAALKNSHPTIIKKLAYFGTISEHVDITIFQKLIDEGYEILFWGVDDYKLLPSSIINMGYISDQNLLHQSISSSCDAIIIPYCRELNGVYPAKLSLSLATGLPVFCSKFYDSLKLSDLIYVYKDFDDLLQIIHLYTPNQHQKRLPEIKLFLDSISIANYYYKFNSLITGNLID
jgi:hypothetical protein